MPCRRSERKRELRKESGNSPFTAWLWMKGNNEPTSEPVSFADANCSASAAHILPCPANIEPKPVTAVVRKKLRRFTRESNGADMS